MIIYKITNKVNGKIYIGQTTRSLEKRKQDHIQRAIHGVNTHLYCAMRKYGIENFVFEEIDQADNEEDLNYLESYYILKYDSVRTGYNMSYGGDNNVMFSEAVRKKHARTLAKLETRKHISDGMKKYREEHPFTAEHRKHISESLRSSEAFQTMMHNKPKEDYDTRSIFCYCVCENGEEKHFHSYRDAWHWWMTIDNPFTTKAECIYQRKIKQSIATGYYTYKHKTYFYPRWYKEEGDNNEKVTDQKKVLSSVR